MEAFAAVAPTVTVAAVLVVATDLAVDLMAAVSMAALRGGSHGVHRAEVPMVELMVGAFVEMAADHTVVESAVAVGVVTAEMAAGVMMAAMACSLHRRMQSFAMPRQDSCTSKGIGLLLYADCVAGPCDFQANGMWRVLTRSGIPRTKCTGYSDLLQPSTRTVRWYKSI